MRTASEDGRTIDMQKDCDVLLATCSKNCSFCCLQQHFKNYSHIYSFPRQIPEHRGGAMLLLFTQDRVKLPKIIANVQVFFEFAFLRYTWYNMLADIWQIFSFLGFASSLSFRMTKPDNLSAQMVFLSKSPFPDPDFQWQYMVSAWKKQYEMIVVKQLNITCCGKKFTWTGIYSCYMLEAFNNNTKYYAIRKKSLEILFKKLTENPKQVTIEKVLQMRISWIEGSKLCRRFQKNLPFFTSKTDILRMITHLHTLPYYLANCCPKIAQEMLAAYAGLILKGNSKVSSCLKTFENLLRQFC